MAPSLDLHLIFAGSHVSHDRYSLVAGQRGKSRYIPICSCPRRSFGTIGAESSLKFQPYNRPARRCLLGERLSFDISRGSPSFSAA